MMKYWKSLAAASFAGGSIVGWNANKWFEDHVNFSVATNGKAMKYIMSFEIDDDATAIRQLSNAMSSNASDSSANTGNPASPEDSAAAKIGKACAKETNKKAENKKSEDVGTKICKAYATELDKRLEPNKSRRSASTECIVTTVGMDGETRCVEISKEPTLTELSLCPVTDLKGAEKKTTSEGTAEQFSDSERVVVDGSSFKTSKYRREPEQMVMHEETQPPRQRKTKPSSE